MDYHGKPMETVATKLPPTLVQGVDSLIRRGRYPNRSDLLRVAVRKLVEEEVRAPRTADPRDQERFDQYRRTMIRLGKDPRYRNRYVAVHDEKVVDDDVSFDALVKRIMSRKEHPIQVGLANPEGGLMRAKVPGARIVTR